MNEYVAKTMHEDQRRNLWCAAAVAVARSSNCTLPSHPPEWADRVLAEFDIRFPDPMEHQPDPDVTTETGES